MSRSVFFPGDILLPRTTDMLRWSVIACDQFSAQPDYWEAVEALVGDQPSTRWLMLPEAYLKTVDTEAETKKINATMERYQQEGIFQCMQNSYIYIERTLPSGDVRKGLLGLLDLEAYDYSSNTDSMVRPTEGTVESRLPARVHVREGATLEMPHIVVFIDDAERQVIEPFASRTAQLQKLYDFDLMLDGGHLAGWRIHARQVPELEQALIHLGAPEIMLQKYDHTGKPVVYAVGDGNHSLATAKVCWEQLKKNLTPEQQKTHPARYSLVELVNLHDDAIAFEAIHRAVFETNPTAFLKEAQAYWTGVSKAEGEAHEIICMADGNQMAIEVKGLTIGQTIAAADAFCEDYIATHGGEIDYIHGDDTVVELAAQAGCAGILLPSMDKEELYPSILKSGVFPRKSFSIGHAQEKRYYLECRAIR